MKIQKLILTSIAIAGAMLSCSEPEPVNIYGNIAGKITDESTGEAIDGVTVEISGINQTQKTGSNGSYSFEKIPADDYTVYVSKSGYVSDSKTVTVVASKTAQGDFSLNKDLPVANPNSLTLTNNSYSASIELKNTRSGEMNYTIETSKAWLLVSPVSGTIASMNSRIIKVTVDLDKVSYGEYNEKLTELLENAGYSVFLPQRDGMEAARTTGMSEEKKAEAISVCEAYEEDGISGWRTFTTEEAKEFRDQYDDTIVALSDMLAENGLDRFNKYDCRYLCNDFNSTFCFYNTQIVKSGETVDYALRLVKKVRVEKAK